MGDSQKLNKKELNDLFKEVSRNVCLQLCNNLTIEQIKEALDIEVDNGYNICKECPFMRNINKLYELIVK